MLSYIDISHFNMMNVIAQKGAIIYNNKNIPDEVVKQIPERSEKIIEK